MLNKRSYYVLSILFVLSIMGLYTYKAINSSITIDEASSFLIYSRHSIFDIFNFTYQPTANNHILNSLLIKWSSALFGVDELSVRLPNLLAGLLFGFSTTALLAQVYKKQYLWALAGLSLMFINLFQLDFFALARGYGLANGLFMASLYFHYQILTFPKKHYNNWIAFSLSALAVLANFSMLVPYIAIILVSLFLQIWHQEAKKQIIKNNIPTIVISIILTMLIIKPIQKLRALNELYFGGDTGFVESTIRSLAQEYLTGHYLVRWEEILIYGYYPMLLIALWRTIANRKNTNNWSRLLQFSTLLLCSYTIGHILLFYLFDSLFLIQRTAILYYPIIQLVFFSLLSELYYRYLKRYKWSALMPIAIFSLQVYLLPRSFQADYFRQWVHNSEDKKILKYLASSIAPNKKVSFQSYWMHAPSFGFYVENNFFPNIQMGNFSMKLDLETDYDYYFIAHDKNLKEKIETKYKVKQYFGQGILYEKIE